VAGKALYTLPVIVDNTDNGGTVVSDSINIVQYLDAKFPESIQLLPRNSIAAQAAFHNARKHLVMDALTPIMIEKVATILNPQSKEYFRRTREETFKVKLEDVLPSDELRNSQWAKLELGYDTIAKWFTRNEGGTFFMGDKMTYADVVNAASLLWIKALFGEDSTEWCRIMRWQNGWWNHYMAKFKQYEEIM